MLVLADMATGSPDEQTVHCLFSLDRLTRIRIFISLCRSSAARHVVLFSSTGPTLVAAGVGTGPSDRCGLDTRSDRECLCTSCPDFSDLTLVSSAPLLCETPVNIAARCGRRSEGLETDRRGAGEEQLVHDDDDDDDGRCHGSRCRSVGAVTRALTCEPCSLRSSRHFGRLLLTELQR